MAHLRTQRAGSTTPRLGEPPVVSVVTVCFRETPDRIRRTLSSVVSQAGVSVELVVVDGGSPEATVSAIHEFATHISFMVSEPDEGIYDAMNKGVRACSGDLVVFMNIGDRFASPTVLADAVALIQAYPHADFYYGDVLSVVGGRERRIRAPRASTRFKLYGRGICHQGIIARRDCFNRIGGFDTALRVVADQDWTLRALSHGLRGQAIDVVISEYDQTGVSSDPAVRRRERSIMVGRHYNWAERVVMGAAWSLVKAAVRVRCGNFAAPFALRRHRQ